MAAASPSPTSLSLSLDTLLSSSHRLSSPSSLPFPSSSSSSSSAHKPHRHFLSIKSSSSSPSPSPSPPTTTTTTTFLDPTSLHRFRSLDSFHLSHQLPHGSLRIRPMAPHELDATVSLLAESFAESMWMPARYVKLLEFLVRQYVAERRNLLPHSIMLVGFYEEKNNNGESEGGGAQLACTAEVTFDARGAIAAPPTPLPPRNCPYICNMTVKKELRRRGIGWQLLKACEELIFQMKTIRKVYLHCRMIDTVPFQMYKKAGYKIVKQDSILVWLSLQRRKYLMCKELPPLVEPQLGNSVSKDDPL